MTTARKTAMPTMVAISAAGPNVRRRSTGASVNGQDRSASTAIAAVSSASAAEANSTWVLKSKRLPETSSIHCGPPAKTLKAAVMAAIASSTGRTVAKRARSSAAPPSATATPVRRRTYGSMPTGSLKRRGSSRAAPSAAAAMSSAAVDGHHTRRRSGVGAASFIELCIADTRAQRTPQHACGEADHGARLAVMAAPTELEIEANGLRFETLVAGPEDGEAVILLHGYPQSAASWQETMEWLAGRGYRAIAPNLRGYSPGANPPEASAYSMDQLVGDVIGIADALGAERFHLVGHDWGGALAWTVAGAHPQRLLSLTVLSTPHPAALLEAMRSSTQSLRSIYMGFFRIPRVPEAILNVANLAPAGLGLRLFRLPRASWQRDRRQLQRVGGMRGPLNWYRGALKSSTRRHRITVPTMYIWGRRDPFLGRRAAELTAKYVTGRYRFEELKAGHWIVDRNAADLQRLLGEHLASHRAAVPTPSASRPKAAASETATEAAPKRTAAAKKAEPRPRAAAKSKAAAKRAPKKRGSSS